jgi:hypothetical protein
MSGVQLASAFDDAEFERMLSMLFDPEEAARLRRERSTHTDLGRCVRVHGDHNVYSAKRCRLNV